MQNTCWLTSLIRMRAIIITIIIIKSKLRHPNTTTVFNVCKIKMITTDNDDSTTNMKRSSSSSRHSSSGIRIIVVRLISLSWGPRRGVGVLLPK